MGKEPIKTWSFETKNNINYIDYYGDKVGFRTNTNETHVEYDIKRILESKRPFGNTEIDNELMAYIIQHTSVQENLEEGDKKLWCFWKSLDSSKLPSATFLGYRYSDVTKIIEIGPNILSIGDLKNDGSKGYRESFRLTELFFNGPTIPALSLEDRKAIIDYTLNALGDESGFSKKDAFVLFDYSKIKPKEWEIRQNKFDSQYVKLTSDCLAVGTTSHPAYSLDFGGSERKISFEEAWLKQPIFVAEKFKANNYIYKQLKNAIINL